MNEEKRTLMKLSGEARRLWRDTEAIYRSPVAMSTPEAFNGLRTRLSRLPNNQRRYYKRLLRIATPRFYRSTMRLLKPEEFEEMLRHKDAAELLLICEQLRLLIAEQLEPEEERRFLWGPDVEE